MQKKKIAVIFGVLQIKVNSKNKKVPQNLRD